MYFTVIEHKVCGETQPQTLVSTKGLEWINKKLKKNWLGELENIKQAMIQQQ